MVSMVFFCCASKYNKLATRIGKNSAISTVSYEQAPNIVRVQVRRRAPNKWVPASFDLNDMEEPKTKCACEYYTVEM